MNKILAVIGLTLLVLPTLVAADLIPTGANIAASVLKYDPSPAEPGQYLDVWIAVENQGTGTVNDYVLEFIPAYPFSLASDDSAIRNFAFIDADGARAKYHLRVAEDAPSGDAILKVKHYQKGSSTSVTEELPISISGKVDVIIGAVTPDTLIPGQAQRVTFTFNNTGLAPVRDLQVVWSDPEAKILPLAGENRYTIKSLDVGKSVEVVFNMVADPSTTQGVRLINVVMSYQRFGSTDSRTAQIALIVGGLTNFDVAQQEISNNRLSISVANIGVNTATGVLITIPDQPNWKVIGGSSSFLGNLNAGDFTVASFTVQSATKESNQMLKTIIEYTDTTGIRQNVEKEFNVNLVQPAQQQSQQQNPIGYIVLGIVLAVAGSYGYNRFIKKKKR